MSTFLFACFWVFDADHSSTGTRLLLESRAKMRPSPAHARTRTRAHVHARAHAHARTRAHAHTRTARTRHAHTRTCARTRLRADHFTSPVTCKSAAIFHRTHMDKSRDQRQHWQQQIVAGVQAAVKNSDFLGLPHHVKFRVHHVLEWLRATLMIQLSQSHVT